MNINEFHKNQMNMIMDSILGKSTNIPIRIIHTDRSKCYNQDGLCEEDNCRCDYRAEGAKEFNKIEQ